jgi:hypothetical protein
MWTMFDKLLFVLLQLFITVTAKISEATDLV